MITGTTPKPHLRSRPLQSYNVIRPDTNFSTSSPKSVPSKIKTQRNGITCMQLTSPKVHLSQTIHDWHHPPRIVPYRAIIYAYFSTRTPMTVAVSNTQVKHTLIAYIYQRVHLSILFTCLLDKAIVIGVHLLKVDTTRRRKVTPYRKMTPFTYH